MNLLSTAIARLHSYAHRSCTCSGKDASFIKRLRERLDEYSVKLPSVTIEYRDLTVKTDALVGSAGIPTVVSTILAKVKQVLGMKQQTVEVSVVDGVSGVLKPGRMTLVLGPPSCGKSTFMKVSTQCHGLFGKLPPARCMPAAAALLQHRCHATPPCMLLLWPSITATDPSCPDATAGYQHHQRAAASHPRASPDQAASAVHLCRRCWQARRTA